MAPAQRASPLGSVPSGVSTWFAGQEAPLLAHRAVRGHLSAYSPHVWPEVTKLTLLYGIAALRKAYGTTLSVGELAEVVGACARGGRGATAFVAVGRCSALLCSGAEAGCVAPARAQVAVTVEAGLPELLTKARARVCVRCCAGR